MLNKNHQKRKAIVDLLNTFKDTNQEVSEMYLIKTKITWII